MYTKKNTRVTFRSNRRPSFKRNNNFSNGKSKNKGNVTQQYNKYLKLAKESSSSGDRIQSEYYYQFTDHYYRLMLEMGINIEENEGEEDNRSSIEVSEVAQNTDNENSTEEKKETISSTVTEEEEEEDDENDVGSIESVPFISKPIKKKVTKVAKVKVKKATN